MPAPSAPTNSARSRRHELSSAVATVNSTLAAQIDERARRRAGSDHLPALAPQAPLLRHSRRCGAPVSAVGAVGLSSPSRRAASAVTRSCAELRDLVVRGVRSWRDEPQARAAAGQREHAGGRQGPHARWDARHRRRFTPPPTRAARQLRHRVAGPSRAGSRTPRAPTASSVSLLDDEIDRVERRRARDAACRTACASVHEILAQRREVVREARRLERRIEAAHEPLVLRRDAGRAVAGVAALRLDAADRRASPRARR